METQVSQSKDSKNLVLRALDITTSCCGRIRDNYLAHLADRDQHRSELMQFRTLTETSTLPQLFILRQVLGAESTQIVLSDKIRKDWPGQVELKYPFNSLPDVFQLKKAEIGYTISYLVYRPEGIRIQSDNYSAKLDKGQCNSSDNVRRIASGRHNDPEVVDALKLSNGPTKLYYRDDRHGVQVYLIDFKQEPVFRYSSWRDVYLADLKRYDIDAQSVYRKLHEYAKRINKSI
jgi:hypothetical protein